MGGARSAANNNGGGGTKYSNVNYLVLAAELARQKDKMLDLSTLVTARMERDEDLLHKAFIREIKVGYDRLHGKYIEEERGGETGDLEAAIRRRKRGGSSADDMGEEKKCDRDLNVNASVNFTLTRKGKEEDKKGGGAALVEYIDVCPNFRTFRHLRAAAKYRKLGENTEVNKFVENLVKVVKFEDVVEGFAAMSRGEGGVEGGGGGDDEKEIGFATTEKPKIDDNDNEIMPKKWWVKERVFEVLRHEIHSLIGRKDRLEQVGKELKLKTKHLNEAIDVVRKR